MNYPNNQISEGIFRFISGELKSCEHCIHSRNLEDMLITGFSEEESWHRLFCRKHSAIIIHDIESGDGFFRAEFCISYREER